MWFTGTDSPIIVRSFVAVLSVHVIVTVHVHGTTVVIILAVIVSTWINYHLLYTWNKLNFNWILIWTSINTITPTSIRYVLAGAIQFKAKPWALQSLATITIIDALIIPFRYTYLPLVLRAQQTLASTTQTGVRPWLSPSRPRTG